MTSPSHHKGKEDYTLLITLDARVPHIPSSQVPMNDHVLAFPLLMYIKSIPMDVTKPQKAESAYADPLPEQFS